MPFGLDLKSLIVGALFAWFVLPLVMGKLSGFTSRTTEA